MSRMYPGSVLRSVGACFGPTELENLLRRALLRDEEAVARGLRELAVERARPHRGPLEEAVVAGLPERLPNTWQIALGVARMQHRLITRRESVGVARAARRPGLLPLLFENQLVRAPFLLLDGSVVPGDLSGLRSSPATIMRHLLGTYHARREANYDLEILAARAPHALVELRAACAGVIEGTHPHARRWRTLCVYEGAHEELLVQIDAALRGDFLGTELADPDVSFFAYLRFCARQPATAASTFTAWRDGRFQNDAGVVAV